MNSKRYDIFISYSSHDKEQVTELCNYLEQHNLRCFVAHRDIPRGVVWARSIVEAIERSRMMIVVFSKSFNESEHVDREIELACEAKMPILSVRLSSDVYTGAKRYYLNNINWIDAFPEPSRVYGDVLHSISCLLGDESEAGAQMPNAVPEVAKPSRRRWSASHIVFTAVLLAFCLGAGIYWAIKSGTEQGAKPCYKVGDYYNQNNKEGVVFQVWDDGRHGKLVSMDEAELKWCSDEQYRKKTHVDASNRVDGKANTDKVVCHVEAAQYPAFNWCRAKGGEWYLPAIDELVRFTLDKEIRMAINLTLSAKGYRELDGWYWSSTDYADYEPDACAWYVWLSSNEARGADKNKEAYVRAITTF